MGIATGTYQLDPEFEYFCSLPVPFDDNYIWKIESGAKSVFCLPFNCAAPLFDFLASSLQ